MGRPKRRRSHALGVQRMDLAAGWLTSLDAKTLVEAGLATYAAVAGTLIVKEAGGGWEARRGWRRPQARCSSGVEEGFVWCW